jgi:hypothetical protein
VEGNWGARENFGMNVGKENKQKVQNGLSASDGLSALQPVSSNPIQGERMNTGKEKPAIVVEPAEDPIRTSEPISVPEPAEIPVKEPTPA